MGKEVSLKNLATEITELLDKYDCQDDTRIYYDQYVIKYNAGSWETSGGVSPRDYFEYVNDNTISMSFEGYFYEVINYGILESLHKEFENLLRDNGLYYEQGNAWNLSLYEI